MVAELILLLTKHHISCWSDCIEIARNEIIPKPDQGLTWQTVWCVAWDDGDLSGFLFCCAGKTCVMGARQKVECWVAAKILHIAKMMLMYSAISKWSLVSQPLQHWTRTTCLDAAYHSRCYTVLLVTKAFQQQLLYDQITERTRGYVEAAPD